MLPSIPFIFPERVSNILKKAGWAPGVDRRLHRSRRTFFGQIRDVFKSDYQKRVARDVLHRNALEHTLATSILNELDGIEVRGDSQDGPYVANTIIFGHGSRSLSYPDEDIRLLEAALRRRVCPIGEVLSSSVLCITNLGEVFEVANVSVGVIYDGLFSGGALQRILCGHKGAIVRFSEEQDPGHALDFGPITDTAPIVHITSNGDLVMEKWNDGLPP